MNGLEALIENYKENVAEKDKEGFATAFKKATEIFFNEFTNFTYTDVEYLDGYFFSARGSNSIVHFHVKEIPDWIFAIWWQPLSSSLEKNIMTGTFFCQFEKTLDKFKPSCSAIKVDNFAVNIIESDWINVVKGDYEISKTLEFMRDEPYLAFCRDHYGWNYNFEYHTREEAEKEYREWYAQYAKREAFCKHWDKELINFINATIVSQFKNAELHNTSEKDTPFYDEIIAPYEGNENWIDEPDAYNLRISDNKNIQNALNKIDSFIEEVREKAKKENVFYRTDEILSNSAYSCIYFYNRKEDIE